MSEGLMNEGKIANRGEVSWRCPSNIALIKYWGKHGEQLPRNASISFTLNNAHTDTTMKYEMGRSAGKPIVKKFSFEGKEQEDFRLRIEKYFQHLSGRIPFLKEIELEISSTNSFPHSSGIASSASSMGALALGLCSIEQELFGQLSDKEEFFGRASYIARLGSGSASRSVFPYLAAWGQHDLIEGSDDEFAVPFDEVDEVFKTFHNDILIVSDEKKSVSSSAGHQLMENNVFAPARYEQAKTRMNDLLESLKTGNLEVFGKIVEDEAMTLHALMMCSDPSYVLLEPGTLSIIKKIRSFRKETNIPVYFSLDAGPNIHLMFPDRHKQSVKEWQNNALRAHCVNGLIIEDQVGQGPKKL